VPQHQSSSRPGLTAQSYSQSYSQSQAGGDTRSELRRNTSDRGSRKGVTKANAGGAKGGTNVNIANLRSQYGKKSNTNSSTTSGTGTAGKKSNMIHSESTDTLNSTSRLFPIPHDAALEYTNKNDQSIMKTAEELYGDGAGLGSTPSRQTPSSQSSGSSGRRMASSKTIHVGGQPAGNIRHTSAASKSTSLRSSGGTNSFKSLDKENALDHLANSGENGNMTSMEAAANVIKNGNNIFQKKMNVGANVLVALTLLDNVAFVEGVSSVAQLKESTSAPVNKLGFPEGEGRTDEERNGPYVYVLATVKSVHFGEDDRYYTVERFDTRSRQRADRGWMEWIEPGSEGEQAAMAAAKRTPDMNPFGEVKRTKRIFSENSCFSKTERIVGIAKEFLTRQAELITKGGPPYRIEMRFTTVNFLVICSFVVAFLDQIKYAFLTSKSDKAIRFIIL